MTDQRKTFLITGSDADNFLQGLVTNDVGKLEQGLVYTALLTPQGKYIADFFLSRHEDGILLDVDASLADALAKRLAMYRLRADVDITDWTAVRVAHAIPATGIELTPDTYILEVGFERLNGVDFRKGCYVGQEVTARMKHKTELKKGLVQVEIDGSAPVGTEITSNGKPAGTLFSQSGGKALAYLRFDRATGPMQAGDATVAWHRTE